MVGSIVLVKPILVINKLFLSEGAYSEINYRYTNRVSHKFRYGNMVRPQKGEKWMGGNVKIKE